MLPRSNTAFREIVASAHDAAARDGLLANIINDYNAANWSRTIATAKKAEAKLRCEQRLLEFVRVPVLRRDPEKGDPLDRVQERACQELTKFKSEAFADLLSLWIDTGDRSARVAASYFLGNLALDSRVERVTGLIGDEDWLVAAAAIRGAGLASRHKRATRSFRKTVFDACTPMVTGAQQLPDSVSQTMQGTCYIESIIHIQRHRAVALYRSRRCLYLDNPLLKSILHYIQPDMPCMDGYPPVVIKPEILWPLYEGLLAKHNRQPNDRLETAIGLLLVLAATSEPERVHQEARAAKKTAGNRWSPLFDYYANQALRRAKKISEPNVALEWLEHHPGELDQQAEEILRAYELVDHINSDGLGLYLLNCSNTVPQALCGLVTLKQNAAASIIRSAAKLIGLPSDMIPNETDFDLIAQLQEEHDGELVRLEDRFEKHHDRILIAIERFMKKHPKKFLKVR